MPRNGVPEEPRTDDVPLRRLKAVGLASMAVLLVAAMTVAFTNTSGARSIAIDSGHLHWSNVTSGVAAITRASLNQTAIFAIDERLGVSSPDATIVALDEARASLKALDDLTRRVPADLRDIGIAVVGLVEEGNEIVAALEVADTDAAVVVLDNKFELQYLSIAMSLGDAQALYASKIESAESIAAQIETAMRWLATLLIPGLAVVLYRSIVRRRYRRTEVEFTAHLKAERRISLAKDEFIAAISHELRTPLTTIVGFTDHLIEQGLEDREEATKLLRIISYDSEELTRMVEDLLTAARVDGEALAFDYAETDLHAEALAIVDRVRRQGVSIDVYGDAPTVWADGARVRQVIRNLVSNAVRHGGDEIVVRIRSGANQASFSVIDNGEGVPDAIQERLFEPFVHESKATLLSGSVGLGLAIVRSLTAAMGGEVAYQRRDGRTWFSFSLPLSPAARAGSYTTTSAGGATDVESRLHRGGHAIKSAVLPVLGVVLILAWAASVEPAPPGNPFSEGTSVVDADLVDVADPPAAATPDEARPPPTTTSTTATSTTTPPRDTAVDIDPGAGGIGTGPRSSARNPVGTSSIVLYPAFLPTPWAPNADLSVDDALKATGVPLPSAPARALPPHSDPVTGGAPTLTTTGSSLRNQFTPAVILGVLIAWATVTVFEFRREDDPARLMAVSPLPE